MSEQPQPKATSYYRHEDGGVVEIVERTQAVVKFAPQGGGFVFTMPAQLFDSVYQPTELKTKYTQLQVTGDWMDNGESLPAYCGERRWNGWVMPLFEHETAMQIANKMGTVYYDEEQDAFVDENDPDDVYAYKAETIEVDGQTLKVYALGAGSWCWERAREPEQSADRPRGG